MTILILSTMGAIIMLDKYAFGEFGISQPIVTGALIGLFFGNVAAGLFLGAVIQLIFLAGLPIGREIPPDGHIAGIIGCGSYFLMLPANSSGHALFFALIFALTSALLGGKIDIAMRHYNERLYHRFIKNKASLTKCHLLGLLTAFLRSACILFPIFILSYLIIIPEQLPEVNQQIALIIGVSIGFANAIYLFTKKSTIPYIIAGGICSLILLVL